MNRAHHHLLGAVTGAWLGVGLGWPSWQVGVAAGLAAAIAPAPDIDNHRSWQFADGCIPDEILGHGGPMRHRGILHHWSLPLAAGIYLAVATPGPWWAWALVTGWVSHIVADFAVGARSKYRGPGIPIMPWWGYAGLGFRNGGVADWVICASAVASTTWPVGGLLGIWPAVTH